VEIGEIPAYISVV